MNKLYTLSEVRDILQISAPKLRALIKSGDLKSIDLSAGKRRKTIRITSESLDLFIERMEN